MTKEYSNTANSPLISNNILSDQGDSNGKYENHLSVTSDLILTDSKNRYTQLGLSGSNFGHKLNPTLSSTDSVNTNNVDSRSRYGDFFTTLSTSIISSENWQYEPSNNEEDIGNEAFGNDEFETYDGEGVLSIPEIDAVLIDKELSCDDLYEYDATDDLENTDPHYSDEIQTTVKLNRYEKAKQIATEVIQAYSWDKENISLLEQIFFEHGWGMTRVSIERELNNGLMPEELKLALFIRQLWTENQQYWISFLHITSNQPGQESKAAYKTMSWVESLRIIRSFRNVPSEEEIQIFVYQLYDDWYCSTTLQRQHKAFIKYLKYRTCLDRRSLAGNEFFSFFDSYYEESL